MPEREARKGCSFWIWLVVGLLGVLACVALLIAVTRSKAVSPASLKLPDGSVVRVFGATYGTNHVFGSPFARVASRMPAGVQDVLGSLFGPRAVAYQKLSTPSPTLVVWLSRQGYGPSVTPSYMGYLEAYLGDTAGFVSGASAGIWASTPVVMPLQFPAFPRRDLRIVLHFYDHSSTGKVKECGSLEVANPAYRSYPQWQPESLPSIERAGNVEARLEQFSTGHGNNMSFYPLKGSGTGVDFGTNREGGQNETGFVLHLRALTNTNQEWKVDHVVLSDATGNSLASSSMTWSGPEVGAVGFSPGLWTNEAAWKLRCEIKRAKGFSPQELLTFKNVPLGASGQTNRIGWSTNVNGVTVTLDYLVRRPPVTNNTWSSGQFSEARFLVLGVNGTNDLHVDLLETRADDGRVVDVPSSSTGYHSQEYGLRNVPLEAMSLDFTFAVQQGRWVGFFVKPETGQVRVEHRAGY